MEGFFIGYTTHTIAKEIDSLVRKITILTSLILLVLIGCHIPKRRSVQNQVDVSVIKPEIEELEPTPIPTEENSPVAAGYEILFEAPELHDDVWINSEPLKLSDLRGKVVLLEMWTFGCYNCRNVQLWHTCLAYALLD